MEDIKLYQSDIPEIDIEKIEESFTKKIAPKMFENYKKYLNEIMNEVEQSYHEEVGFQFSQYIDDIALKKAKQLVNGLLTGKDNVLEEFLRRDIITRKRLLDSVIEYAAKEEIKQLRERLEYLQEMRNL